MTVNKKFLIGTAAGLVALVIVATSISKCTRNADENEEIKKALIEAGKTMKTAEDAIVALKDSNDKLGKSNKEKSDTIVMLKDSIVVLNDSLDVVNGKLRDCEEGKRPCPPKPVVKPKPVKPVPVQPEPVVYHDTLAVNRGAGTIINLKNHSRNSGDIVVANGQNTGNTAITLEGGSVNEGTITVNNGGVINNFYGDTASVKTTRYVYAGSSTTVIKKVKVYSRSR